MNSIFSLEACSKYSDKFKASTFQLRFSVIVPYMTIAFALEGKISYKAFRSFFKTGRVFVGSQMSEKLTLVLMAGLPSAGKSTLASALGRDRKWYVVDKDKYRKKFLQWCFNEEKASYNAYEVAFAIVRYMLAEKRASVILDCVGLHDFILENVINVARTIENVQLKVILCVVDRDLRKERLSKRPPQRVVINDDLETDDDYFKVYKLPKEDTFVLHTDNRTVEECLAEAKEFLDVINDYAATNATVEECLAETEDHLDEIEYALRQV